MNTDFRTRPTPVWVAWHTSDPPDAANQVTSANNYARTTKDPMEQDLKKIPDDELLSLQTLVSAELALREEGWRKKLAKLQLARGNKQGLAPGRQRATRSDKGKPKVPRAFAAGSPEIEPTPLDGVVEGRMDNAFVTTVEPDKEADFSS